MQVVLRIERSPAPSRTGLLEAAAAAALAVCLDPRSAPGGEWHAAVSAWLGGRIRKVARRARGAHWLAVQELAGVTVCADGAQARALVPGLVAQVPHEVGRLQISGSELPLDDPGPPPPGRPVLWLNPDVPMTAGKAAAQVGHATMILAALLHADGAHDALATWRAAGFRCAVRTPVPGTWSALREALCADAGAVWQEQRAAAVRDAGFTEVDPGTITVIAFDTLT
jgi:peptidyl-tRNA hydrolase